jgi:hypothetical protein
LLGKGNKRRLAASYLRCKVTNLETSLLDCALLQPEYTGAASGCGVKASIGGYQLISGAGSSDRAVLQSPQGLTSPLSAVYINL